jgi:type I restriction enzyme R subunit
LTFLIPKLPAPQEKDLSKGILETIDMDSYRAEKKAAIKIQLPDQSAEIEPVRADAYGGRGEPNGGAQG